MIFICTKCAGKRGALDHKGRTKLRGELKDALKECGAKKAVRIVETSCFGLCPKDGQTVAIGRELAEGKLRVFTRDDDVEDLVAALSEPKRG